MLSHRGYTELHFNGDGHHALKVESTGPAVPFPQHTLEYTVRSGDSWGAPITLHEVLLPAGPPTGHHAPSDTGHRRTGVIDGQGET
ncbi:hypothetical protein [Streptomyces sp. H27-H5]|uniref:hypothetical protein n=1 Tax=Streptomyces sp. H27-H5 TaxID=2996460 RepID=UPI003B6340BF